MFTYGLNFYAVPDPPTDLTLQRYADDNTTKVCGCKVPSNQPYFSVVNDEVLHCTAIAEHTFEIAPSCSLRL